MPVENSNELDRTNSAEVASEDLARAFSAESAGGKTSGAAKTPVWAYALGVLGILGGVACGAAAFLIPKPEVKELEFPEIPSQAENDHIIYSRLTGLPVASEAEVTAPTYCVQVPNGLDGARPQAGLDEAGVVFEAIAERGITRFAAIFQNPSSAVVGPIRSLRLYYLQWDTPFDCTIVHAGGADDALAAVKNGGYKDLTENYEYMYRSYAGVRLWNNLFTNGTELKQFSADRGYATSNVNGFTRMTPEEAERARIDTTVAEKLDITEASSGGTQTLTPTTTAIAIDFGWSPSFNVRYYYDAASNSYFRSYADGEAHQVYECPRENLGDAAPENACSLAQLNPTVVIAMEVEQHTAWDGYHEDITAIGSGTAFVFQNGVATRGTWRKGSAAEQIRFYDENGDEIALVPGQVFVSAVPSYGEVSY